MNIEPGSIGFAHTHGAMGWLIRFGQALRFKKGSEWNHVFVVSDEIIEGLGPRIIQATLRGVTDTAPLSTVSPGGRYIILDPIPGVDPAKVLEFAKAQVGLRYGYMTILAIACDIVTWNWVPAFCGSRKPSWICSALGGESLRFGGWLHNWVNSATVTPCALYDALNP